MSSSDAARALQQAVYARLYNDTNLMQRVSGIYDYVPQIHDFPYVYLSTLRSNDTSARRLDVYEVQLELSIWSLYEGKKQALDLATIIEDLLVKESLPLVGHSLVTLQAEQQGHTVLNDEATRLLTLRYRATIIKENS